MRLSSRELSKLDNRAVQTECSDLILPGPAGTALEAIAPNSTLPIETKYGEPTGYFSLQSQAVLPRLDYESTGVVQSGERTITSPCPYCRRDSHWNPTPLVPVYRNLDLNDYSGIDVFEGWERFTKSYKKERFRESRFGKPFYIVTERAAAVLATVPGVNLYPVYLIQGDQ
jgi:hypothetical protein